MKTILKRTVLLSAVAISFLAVSPLAAQAHGRGFPGDRVRVQPSGAPAVEAWLVRVTADSVTYAMEPDGTLQTTVPLREIERLEVSRGRSRKTLRGAGIGLLGGAGLGAVISAATWEPCTDTGLFSCMLEPDSRAGAAVLGAVVLGIPGTVLGGIIGFATVRERWEPVIGSPAVKIVPQSGGGVMVAVRYRE